MIIENWFILSLIVTLIAGITAFINKIIVEEEYDRNISILTFFITIFCISVWILMLSDTEQISLLILWYGLLWGIADYIFMKCRFIALSGISSSLFFVNYRLFSSAILLLVWILIFWDQITAWEYIGFFVWFLVFWLLFEAEKVKNLDYKKGMIFLLICIVMIVFLQSWFKFIGKEVHNMINFWFHFSILLIPYSITWFILTYIKNHRKIDFSGKNIKKNIIINICHGILWMSYILYLMKAYFLADLWIVYKIHSYSLFIPIFLSMIFYHEKLTYKKIIAFILTMISLWFFL